MTPHDLKRKLTAILSADAKGYSRLMGEDEESTVRTLNAYKEVIRGLVGQHRGRVVDSPGITFSPSSRASSMLSRVRSRSSRSSGRRTPSSLRTGGWSSASGSTSAT